LSDECNIQGIVVKTGEVVDVLTSYLGRKPTKKELELFLDYLECDVRQWLVDNAKHWVAEVLPEEQLEVWLGGEN